MSSGVPKKWRERLLSADDLDRLEILYQRGTGRTGLPEMGKHSDIGWTEATWNPWTGCRKKSPGCTNCYMFTEKKQYGQDPTRVARSKTTFRDPLKWKNRTVIFTCSWSDWFIEEADDGWRAEAWEIIRQTPQHIYQILTKRPERMLEHLPWITEGTAPWPNVWLGVSVETQRYADERIPLLLQAPAALRFISCEPTLGPIDLRPYLPDLDWIIVGGESGAKRRPMELPWLEQIVRDCFAYERPIFVKQDVALKPGQQGRIPDEVWKFKETPLNTVRVTFDKHPVAADAGPDEPLPEDEEADEPIFCPACGSRRFLVHLNGCENWQIKVEKNW